MRTSLPPDAAFPFVLIALAALVAVPHDAQAPCDPEWLPTFGSMAGTSSTVHAMVSAEEAEGLVLYAGGAFELAGGRNVHRVARWDGQEWSALGGGLLNGDVLDLAWYDGGVAGPSLYAAGGFTATGAGAAKHVARWNGHEWLSLTSGLDAPARALAVFQGELFVGGCFTSAGGLFAPGLARWNGAGWSTAVGGIAGCIVELLVFDDGSGAKLVAAGDLKIPGTPGTVSVAAFDGATWTALADTANGVVWELAAFDDGAGPKLYAAGGFTAIDGGSANRIARFDGSAWSALGGGLTGSGTVEVLALAVVQEDAGPRLYVGGGFASADGVAAANLAAWDGTAWSAPALAPGKVSSLFALGAGDDEVLIAGANLTQVPLPPPATGTTPIRSIARYDGSTWSALGDVYWDPIGLPDATAIRALEVFDDGAGPRLYAGGRIDQVGSIAANSILRWNGVQWEALADGLGWDVLALEVFDDGDGPALYAGGTFALGGSAPFSRVARWKDGEWSPLGTGESSCAPGDCGVRALLAWDDGSGPALYAAGDFTALGGVAASRIARWDGTTWSPLGSGLNGRVHALAVFDDGGGPALFATGEFSDAGGVTVQRVAKWDGASWSSIGGFAYPGTGRALAVFDDGSGPALYVGGTFTAVEGLPTKGVARWNGSAWSAVGDGLYEVYALAGIQGPAPRLFAAGGFEPPESSAGYVAQWDGEAWSPLGSGLNDEAYALGIFNDGSGPALYAGGRFTAALDSNDARVARWGCAPSLAPIPGCAGNPASLDALSKTAAIGQPLALALETGAIDAGLASLFVGQVLTDPAGCGISIAGIGELLLSPSPVPAVVAQTPIDGGDALFVVGVPDVATLVGLAVGAQAIGVDLGSSPPLEPSDALAIRFTLF